MSPHSGQTDQHFEQHVHQHAQRNNGQYAQQHQVLRVAEQPFKQNTAQAACTNQRRDSCQANAGHSSYTYATQQHG